MEHPKFEDFQYIDRAKFAERVREIVNTEYKDIAEYGALEIKIEEITAQIKDLDQKRKEIESQMKSTTDEEKSDSMIDAMIDIQGQQIDLQDLRWDISTQIDRYFEASLETERERMSDLKKRLYEVEKQYTPLIDPSQN